MILVLKSLSSGTWRCVVRGVISGVSNECVAFSFNR